MMTWSAKVFILFASLLCPTSYSCPVSGKHINYAGTLKNQHVLVKTLLSGCPLDATSIDLSMNDFTTIDIDAFDGFYDLATINIANNKIIELPIGVFDKPFKSSLTGLYASQNNIRFLNNSLFENNYNLNTLDLSNNTISFIDTNVFHKDLKHLVHVNISYNKLTYFEPWPYVPENPRNDNIDVEFDFRHNLISKFTNTMNWTYNLQEPYEYMVYLQYNEMKNFSSDMIFQYTNNRGDKSILTELISYQVNISNNPFFCDCNIFEIVNDLHASFFLYYRVEQYRYRCASPAHLHGIDFMHDLDFDKIICNVSDECPTNCSCQEQPYIEALIINCTNSNANLVELPQIIPSRSSNIKYVSLYLDGNKISQITKTNYSNIIKNLTVSNNLIKYIDAEALKEMEAIENLDISNNVLKFVPKAIQKLSFDKVKIRNNPLECDCNMTWMKDWVSLSNGAGDSGITCTFERETKEIKDVTEDSLNCNIDKFIIIFSTVMGVTVALILAGIVTAKRCPYETKVLLYRFFRIHPRDQYKVDGVDSMIYDAYLSFDGEDIQVRQWIRTIFMKKLEENGKKKYSFFCPLRDATVGDDYGQDLVEKMSRSRRIFILLSPGYFRDTWRVFESDQAEMEHNANEKTHPRVVYITWNDENEEIKNSLQEEPWKSRLIGKKMLSPDEKFFWSKVRYELPVKPRNKPNRVNSSYTDLKAVETIARDVPAIYDRIEMNSVCTKTRSDVMRPDRFITDNSRPGSASSKDKSDNLNSVRIDTIDMRPVSSCSFNDLQIEDVS